MEVEYGGIKASGGKLFIIISLRLHNIIIYYLII